MDNGYKFEKIKFEKGIFDISIDATYIIHLTCNGRLESIRNQLNKYTPTKTCYILFNEGYKTNKKKIYVDNEDKDLRDCYYTIFHDAIEKNYNNILIHEDDFFYDDKILNNKYNNDINNFLLEKKNEKIIYYLGCIPFLLNKFNSKHNKVIFSAESHAIIYSRPIINEIIKIDREKINCLYDNFLNTNNLFKNNKYTYIEPLCFQLHEITENSKNWLSLNFFLDKNIISNNIFLNALNKIYFEINKEIVINILKLNKEENLKSTIQYLYKIVIL
jgi:hypothetical protein